jgi:serine/threonine-protein kinase
VIGQQIGDYKVVASLGEQSMGMLYAGEHHLLKQKVAIKALASELTAQEGMKERFEREAQVLARLSHPNILRLLNFYNLPEGCFIVTELPEGETLEARIARDGKLPPNDVVKWMIPVLRALAYAHGEGVIHRDLKPANIIVNDATAKILDFGMAKADDTPTLTIQGMTLGTVDYMSREQLYGKTLDARSDIYSLGVTMYEALSGKLPFEDENTQKLVLKIAKQEPAPLAERAPEVPRELAAIVHKCLSKERKDRYETANDLAAALETWLNPVPAGVAPPPEPAPAEPVPAPPPAPPPPPPPPAPEVAPPPPPPAAVEPLAPVAPVAASAPRPQPNLLNGLVIAGAALLVLAGGAGATLVAVGDPLQLVGFAVLGAGVPLGLVILLVGLVKAIQAAQPPT